jgi:hypothetical protein
MRYCQEITQTCLEQERDSRLNESSDFTCQLGDSGCYSPSPHLCNGMLGFGLRAGSQQG